ncbi:MAG: tetratricopeptide repeat protein [Spirochaetales bacterium]|nr:tetratricopeptide repeat protein [Spirochaetales bacterium]
MDDIEKFVSTLNEMGREPEVLAEKGEILKPVPKPEEGLSSDLAKLFEGIAEEPFTSEEVPTEIPEPEEEAIEEAPTTGEAPLEEEFPLEEFVLPSEEFSLEEEEPVPKEQKEIPEDFDIQLPSIEEESQVSEPSLAVPPEPAEEEPVGKEEKGGSELEEISLDNLGGDEFSLGDFGTEFGIVEGVEKAGEEEPAINIPTGAAEVIAAATEGEVFSLTDEQFETFKQALSNLPLNLRRAIEEVIGGNKASDEDQIKLIRYLLSNENILTVASFTGRLLGKPIQVPKGYEKRTGLAYEAEKETFAYFFQERVFPILRLVLATTLAALVLAYAGYQFIYRPLYARSLFRHGYALVEAEKYREGNEYFNRAYRVWPDKEWYFRYADLFIRKKQYALAENKYEELLAWYADYVESKTKLRMERKKDSYFRRALLAYADLESRILENYEKAEGILKRLLTVDMYHWEGLLSLGDNYMRWAEYDPAKYEEARKTYGILLQKYGEKDTILFRFLEYFIRVDEFEEVIRLKEYFEKKKKLELDVYRYAELGGYLIDKGRTEDVQQILLRAYKADPTNPDVHYQLARFFRIMEKPLDERIALDQSLKLYLEKESLSRKELWRLIDTYRRDGEYRLARGEVLEAERSFKEGIRLYEEAVEQRVLSKDSTLGKLYVGLGDLYYYEGSEFDQAFNQYEKAEASFIQDPAVSYRKGYIRYFQRDYEGAIREFLKTEERYPDHRNVLFALGNALYLRNDFFAAEGYYTYLLGKLQEDREKIRFLEPEVKPDDRNLVLNLMKVYNNLGVTLQKLSERTRNAEQAARVLAYLTESIEIYENYSRDQETRVRSETKNLAYLNMRKILYPALDYDLQIYISIPLDLRNQEF